MSNNSKYQTHEKPKRRNWRARCPLARVFGALKHGSFRIFYHPLLENIKKLNDEKNLVKKNSEKSLTMPKKLKGGPFEDFSTSIMSQNIQKLKRSRSAEKN